VLADRLIYTSATPPREIIVFKTPARHVRFVRELGQFRLRQAPDRAPGETISEKRGYVYINGKKLIENLHPAGTT